MVFLVLCIVTALATDFHHIDTQNNVFGDFALGRGYDTSQGQLKEAHAFREGDITYDFMPVTKTETNCITVQSAREFAQKLDIYGELSVSYGMISGSGFLKFDRGEEQMTKMAYFLCTIDRTLFTASVNTDHMYPSAEEIEAGTARKSGLLNPAVEALDSADDKRHLIGDKYVASITYGRRYEVEIKVEYSKQNSWDQVAGGIKASIGLGFLSVSAEINFNMENSESSEDLTMSVKSKSIGFVERTPVKFPNKIECASSHSVDEYSVSVSGRRLLQNCPTEEQIGVGQQMQDMIQDNIDTMNENDQHTDLSAKTGLTKAELFDKLGTAYPLSYTTANNAQWYPMMADNDFTKQVTKNLKEAWMIFAELNQFIEELDSMSDTLYDNYHLFSGATSLSDTFLTYRQELVEEIMALMDEIREYSELHPNTIKDATVYFWARDMREDPNSEDKNLNHLTMDHLSQKVYRLMGMEDSLMEDTNPIGDTCVFHGITADVGGDRVKFAGDVVFGEVKVKHVLFDENGETVSLGYIDHKDDRGQELVFVKSDCSLFQNGKTAWFKNGRYEIVQIGSEEHKDGDKVVKEMLTNIRIEIRPVSTETDSVTIMVTDGDVQSLKLRGDDDHQAVFRVDDNGMLMYLNGYVCGDNFGEYEAKMVCSNLGFSGLMGYETEQRLPANSAWSLALTTMTNLECPKYSTTPEECTYQTHGDEGFDVCDLRSGVNIRCTNEEIEENVEFHVGDGEGCVSRRVDVKLSVSDVCTGESAELIAVDSVVITGRLCASMWTPGTDNFCTVPEGNSVISDVCGEEVITDGTIQMSEFHVIYPDTVSVVGRVRSSPTFSDDVTVTVEVGDYYDSRFAPLDQDFSPYPAFPCRYKGRTLSVTTSLENHWCTVSTQEEDLFRGNTVVKEDGALSQVLEENVHFVVSCVAFPTSAPSVAPSSSPTVVPSINPTTPHPTGLATEEPTFATEEPTVETEEPTFATAEPTVATEEPTGPTELRIVTDQFIVTGTCDVQDNCVSSGNYPQNHENHEECSITVTQTLGITVGDEFELETGYDHLIIDGIDVKAAYSVPRFVAAGTEITWTSDSSVTRTGWQLCFDTTCYNPHPSGLDGWCAIWSNYQFVRHTQLYRESIDGPFTLEMCQEACTASSDCYGINAYMEESDPDCYSCPDPDVQSWLWSSSTTGQFWVKDNCGPVDRLGEECWTVGGCVDDSGETCGYCGTHEGQSMICCRDGWSENHAACNGVDYTSDGDYHQCVVPV